MMINKKTSLFHALCMLKNLIVLSHETGGHQWVGTVQCGIETGCGGQKSFVMFFFIGLLFF
jgi:hypothetical protein